MNHPITIEALLILDAIERRGSFAKAAEELNKATSALSYGVQKLEEQLDITLFERQGRRSVLTAAGRLILDDGRKIIEATVQLADKAKEVATGWEPKLRIALEATMDYSIFFCVLERFLREHGNIEIDITECVLSGAWETLEYGQVDLVVGAAGPVPLQKGYRAISLGQSDLVPVISRNHPEFKRIINKTSVSEAGAKTTMHESVLSNIRRIVTHDTARVNVTRNEGFSSGQQRFSVQTTDQKIHAVLSGIGISHLPRHRIQRYLDEGLLLALPLASGMPESFLAWKITNKGKALQALTKRLTDVKW